MRKKQQSADQHTADSLFTLLLLLMFALFAIMLAAVGAGIYKNAMSHLDENFTSRTAAAYVAEKVRAHDEQGSVRTEFWTENGNTVLVLADMIEGQEYHTYIYFDEHALKELFLPSDKSPKPELGTKIVDLEDFQILPMENQKNGYRYYKITATAGDGRETMMLIPVYSGEGGAV